MSEVKRLEMDHKGLPLVDENGVYVLYEDYAALKEQFDFKQNLTEQVVALQKQCDALAAENAGIKASIEMHAAGFKICPACRHQDECETDDVVWMVREATAATDAYLNSVRAEGVEMAAIELKELAKRSKSEAPKASEHTHADALYLMLFAAQLRAGKDG